MAHLLLIEDEKLLRWALRGRLIKAGHTIDEAGALSEAETHLRLRQPEVVILDVNLPDGSGLDFLDAQREKLAESAVIVFTGDGSIEDAVRAMKLGAIDFLSKPVDQEALLRMVDRATALHRQMLEAEGSRRARESQSKSDVVAESPAMRAVLELARTVAASGSTTVLIHGETGAGKEIVARYVHANSPRMHAPLQAINCAALPETLIESELFGYEKGAFTDAKTSRKGLFELADGGTVVLDEIGELPLGLQAKLLRFLEERTVRRLGGVRQIAVDVRVLALTNRDLREQVQKGLFREDLFYRLHVFPIRVPALRERHEDILPLARAFLHQFSAACAKHFKALAPELEQRLLAHDWTGNVRELRNAMERAVIIENGEVLQGRTLSFAPAATAAGGDSLEGIVPLEEVELLMVRRALVAARGNQTKAARLLQVSRDQLRYRVKRYRETGRMSAEDAGE